MISNAILISGTLTGMSENVKTIQFPNGETKMVLVSVQTEDNAVLPIEVWGDRRIEFCKANIGRRGDFVCSITGTHSTFTNRDGEEAELAYCRLKMKTAILEWEGNANG